MGVNPLQTEREKMRIKGSSFERRLPALIVYAASLLGTASLSTAANIPVAHTPTGIQDAINLAVSGDTLIFSPDPNKNPGDPDYKGRGVIGNTTLNLLGVPGVGNPDIVIEGPNSSSSSGGILKIDASADVEVENLVFDSGSAPDGGAIHGAGNLSIVDCTFQNCVASSRGGAIFTNAELSLTNSTFDSNQASGSGGAVQTFRNSANWSVSITGCVFSGNIGSSAVRISSFFSSTVDIDNTTFSGTVGIGLSLGGDSMLSTVNNCTFINNVMGADVSVEDLSMANSTFTDNGIGSPLGSPSGGLSIVNGSQYHLSTCTFIGNHSGTIGGAIFYTPTDGGQLTVEFSLILGNQSEIDGGGIYMSASRDGLLLIEGSEISNNVAQGSGGGIVSADGGLGFLSITNSDVMDNEAMDSGGGIIIANGGRGSIFNSTVSGNSAEFWGGGLKTVGPTEVNIFQSEFSGNTAVGDGGGGIDIEGGGSLGVFNTAIDGNSGGVGGGVFTLNAEAFFVNGSINNNESNSGGGGVSAQGTNDLRFTGGSVSSNESAGDGGGIFCAIHSGGELRINNNVDIEGNIAQGNGGGLMILQSTGNAAGQTRITASIVDNSAHDGGGMFVDSQNGSHIRFNGTIRDNTASGSGGGVFFESDSMGLDNATVSGNGALAGGGGIAVEDGIVTLSGTTMVQGNSSLSQGGGVFVNQTTASLDVTEDTIIQGNSADEGGGIYMNFGSLDLESTILVQFNLASSNGGGVFLHEPVSVTGLGTQVINNFPDNVFDD